MANEIAIIILDEYSQKRCCDIILVCQNPENNKNLYSISNSNLAAYISFYYILFFLYDNLA